MPGTVVTAELACGVYITNPKSAHINLCLLTCEMQTVKLRHFQQGGTFSCCHLEGSEAPCKYNKPKPARLGLQHEMQNFTHLTPVLPPRDPNYTTESPPQHICETSLRTPHKIRNYPFLWVFKMYPMKKTKPKKNTKLHKTF